MSAAMRNSNTLANRLLWFIAPCALFLAVASFPFLSHAATGNYFVVFKLFPLEEHDAAKAALGRASGAKLVETDDWTGLASNRWAIALGPFPSESRAENALRAFKNKELASQAMVQDGGAPIKR
jgi:hypothetical protein